MKWVVLTIVLFFAAVITALEIFKKFIPLSSKKRRCFEVVVILIALFSWGFKEWYDTWREPTTKQLEEAQRKNNEEIAKTLFAMFQGQFPDTFLTNEQKQYILDGVERTKGNDPNIILEDLIQQVNNKEKEIGCLHSYSCSSISDGTSNFIQPKAPILRDVISPSGLTLTPGQDTFACPAA